MLEARFDEKYPNDLRILVLTDGQNNDGVDPATALAAVNRIGAVVDAIVVGTTPDSNLRRIVTATDGECYQIHSLGEGFELLESESVVSLLARRGGVEKPPFNLREAVNFESIPEKAMTRASAVNRCPTIAPALATKSVVSASAVAAKTCRGGAAEKRIRSELSKVGEGNGIHIFPADDDVFQWRVLVEGPDDSPFKGGVFMLVVVIPRDYPFKPPKIAFDTPVYHFNVNDSGAVCLDILKDSWSPALSVPKCLQAVRGLLSDPNPEDALRQWIAELTLAHKQSGGADDRYYQKASEMTREHASVSVEEWKKRLGC